MEKINFLNEEEPDLSAETLNQLQENVENAINEASTTATTKIGDLSNLETTEKDSLVAAVNEVLKVTGVKTLWTNSNPNVAFASQQITLSSDDYDYLEIFYFNYTTLNKQIQSVKVPKGYNFNLSATIYAADNLHYSSRGATRNSDTKFTFADNKGIASYSPSNILSDNTWNVPIKIIGYKVKEIN